MWSLKHSLKIWISSESLSDEDSVAGSGSTYEMDSFATFLKSCFLAIRSHHLLLSDVYFFLDWTWLFLPHLQLHYLGLFLCPNHSLGRGISAALWSEPPKSLAVPLIRLTRGGDHTHITHAFCPWLGSLCYLYSTLSLTLNRTLEPSLAQGLVLLLWGCNMLS